MGTRSKTELAARARCSFLLSRHIFTPLPPTQPIISPRYKGDGGDTGDEEGGEDGGLTGLPRRREGSAAAPAEADASADGELARRAAALALNGSAAAAGSAGLPPLPSSSSNATPAPPPAVAAAPPPPARRTTTRMPPLGAARQCHENEVAEVVIVCEPEGTSLMMGGLHPRCV